MRWHKDMVCILYHTTQTRNSSPDIRFSGNRGQAVPLGFTARYPEHLKQPPPMTMQLQCDSGVGRSVGRCSAKRPFICLSRRRKALTCIQRTRETLQSTRIKQLDRDGATNHHFHRQMTHFNINGSIIYDINVRENVTSSALNEHHS